MYCKKITQAIPYILATAGLIALSSEGHAERGDLTVMGKYGQTQTDDFNAGNVNVDPDGDAAFGLAIGYEYDANWTIEFSYESGEGTETSAIFADVNVDYTSIGLNGVYRTPIQLGSPYFLGKIGFGKVDLDATTVNASFSDDATGLAFGAGVGYQYSEQLGFEAEYFLAAQEVSFILVSARFHLKN